MKRIPNPELRTKILDHIANLYGIYEKREVNHLSSYVGCRTSAYFSQVSPLPLTEEEVMLFALGYALQDVLTPKDAEAPVYNIDGIYYRPDMSFSPIHSEIEQLIEVKTTRKSAKRHVDPMPETWMDYMMSGCYLRGVTSYDLIVLYMMGNYSPPFPVVYCDTFIFEPGEVSMNWLKILQNKAILDTALKTGVPPAPFQHCYLWECKWCRYAMLCESIKAGG